jgi:beta-glucosidase
LPGCEFTEIGRHIQGIPELGIPTVRMVNGGTGVRGGDCLPEPAATGLPSAPASAATFNPELNRQLGDILGDEARRFGHQVMLAPGMNLHRHPFGGRNYEYQSEDPYLTGVMAVEQIQGIQAHGIHANPKHFAGNEQETQRRQMATRIPPRALHELYLLPFEMAVKDADPASIMCAFPEINGFSACSNEELLNTTLRDDWGFGGYVISDRRAVHDVAPSIEAGVDWELSHLTPLHYSLDPQPGQRGNPGSEGIRAALAAGSISVSDLDQMLRRRYIQMFKFGHFDTNFDALFQEVPDLIAHGRVVREVAEQGIVLLKNENSFLPLSANIRSVALIGAEWFAGMAKLPPRSTRGNNSNVVAPYTVSPLEGLRAVLKQMGSVATVTYDSAAGSQTDRNRAIDLARKSDVVIVMVGDNPHELCDRENLTLPIIPPADPNACAWDKVAPGEEGAAAAAESAADQSNTGTGGPGTDQERLMAELTAAPGVAQKMVVVLKTEGMVLMPWLDRVPALVEAWYPGQEDGTAVANILFGVRNPSGKLPMTFGNSAMEAAHSTRAQFPGVFIDPPHWLDRPRVEAQYTEDLQMGYRWYEANNVAPVFPFGFGLSYTTFAYSDLSVASSVNSQTGSTVLTVTYTIANTGNRQGAESSQVYLTLPPEADQPSKRLVGFQRVDLMPGASQQVSVTIDSSASNHPFSYWVPDNDAPVEGWANGRWSAASGEYTVHVGTSSADTPLVQSITLAPADASRPAASCATMQPALGQVCVNGAWMTLENSPFRNSPASGVSGTSANPPVNPPTSQPGNPPAVPPVNQPSNQPGNPPVNPPVNQPTNQPANPPGNQAANQPANQQTNGRTNPSGSCSTAAPGPDWVCVNGRWVPPGPPLVIGGQVRPPPAASPNASTMCPTAAPAAGWVCVDDRWLPPNDPLVVIDEIGETEGVQVLPLTDLLLIIDSAHLARVRDSLRRGEPQFMAALTALEAEAKRALNVAPMSVMEKTVTPPTGDKHDYMSQAPYWWPDPTKPNGRPYIRRDGRRNPEIDQITDRTNLQRLADTVSTLGLAFYFTGREEYSQHAVRLVRVWFLDAATRMNPHLRFGQGIPGITEGRAAGIVETRFLPKIIDGMTLLQESSAWTAADDEALKDWMREFLQWLLESPLGRSEARRGNNQETWYDVQVVALALYTGQTEVGRTNFEQARADIREEFEPDGRQPHEIARTRAWDYSIFNLTAFLHLAALGDRVGVDLWNYRTADGRSLRQGVEYLIPFATGEKRFPHEQITEFRPSALHPVLRWAAVGWNEPRYRELARQIGGGTRRLELIVP